MNKILSKFIVIISIFLFAASFVAMNPKPAAALVPISASLSCTTLTVSGLPLAGHEYAIWIVGVNISEGNIAVSNSSKITTQNLSLFAGLSNHSLQSGTQYLIRVTDQDTGDRIGITGVTYPSSCTSSYPQIQDTLNFSQLIDCGGIEVTGLSANHQYYLFVNGTSNFYEGLFTSDAAGNLLVTFNGAGSWSSYLPSGQFAWLEVHDQNNYYKSYGINVVQSAGTCPKPATPAMVSAAFVANPTSGGFPGIQVVWKDNSSNESLFELKGQYTDGGAGVYVLSANTTSLLDNARSVLHTCAGANRTTYQVRAGTRRTTGITYSDWSPVYTTSCVQTPPPATATPKPSTTVKPSSTPVPGPICTTTATDIVFLIDTSSSMDSQSRLKQAKAAAVNIANKLYTDPDVRIALIKFGGTSYTKTVLGFTSSSSKSTLISKINGLTTTSGTYMGKGIDTMNNLFKSNGRSGAKKYAILLSDGRADDKSKVQSTITTSASLGIKIYTIGVGNQADLDVTLMKQIASTTKATYYYVADPTLLTSIYNQIAVIICPSLKIADSGEPVYIAEAPASPVAPQPKQQSLFGRFISWLGQTFLGVQDPNSSYASE